jgi:hypothetical protein
MIDDLTLRFVAERVNYVLLAEDDYGPTARGPTILATFASLPIETSIEIAGDVGARPDGAIWLHVAKLLGTGRLVDGIVVAKRAMKDWYSPASKWHKEIQVLQVYVLAVLNYLFKDKANGTVFRRLWREQITADEAKRLITR